jgi:hypothetical protein
VLKVFSLFARAPLLALLTGIGAAYVAVAWHVHRRWGGRGLVALAVVGTLLLGPALFLHSCLQPLTCDAGSLGDYFPEYLPRHVIAVAIALSLVSTVVAWRRRAGNHNTLRLFDLCLGVVTLVLGITLGYGAVHVFKRVICSRQSYRRPEGTIASTCDLYRN